MSGASPESSPQPDNPALTDMLDRLQAQSGGPSLPPVAHWHPSHQGELDLQVRRDGSWWYLGSEIRRSRIVRLFSRILRREPDGRYVLVTPVEKWFIDVVDAPFLVVRMALEAAGVGQRLILETSTDDLIVVDQEHPVYLVEDDQGHPSPYVTVRDDMPGLLSRSVYYELVSHAEQRGDHYGILSCGVFHVLGNVEDETGG